ncbi:Carbon-nitrogen hydrolase [Microbotryomycetes sp. JL201]|nr:Carbon-nitrogen hydrolase [Microbotryomycetes sp. JL201]
MTRVAVGQLCSTPNVNRNLEICQSIIKRAASVGCKLLWLPEASDFIANTADVERLCEALESSKFVKGITQQAKESQIWVGVGVHEQGRVDKRCFNSNLLISPEGDLAEAYRKVHLFDVDIKGGAQILESKTTIRGDRLPKVIPTSAGKVGMQTCYDLRFPEGSLLLRERGAEILTYPSAFTLKTGAAHWETLLRARAIETQTYVLAPAQIGSHTATRQSFGHAMIVDPWGTIVAQAGDRAPRSEDPVEKQGTFAMADIDLEWLETIRRDMPLWQQRRSDVYSLNEL